MRRRTANRRAVRVHEFVHVSARFGWWIPGERAHLVDRVAEELGDSIDKFEARNLAMVPLAAGLGRWVYHSADGVVVREALGQDAVVGAGACLAVVEIIGQAAEAFGWFHENRMAPSEP